MLAAEWGVGQMLWSMFWLFLFVLWISLVMQVFGDIVRSADLSGVRKALWALLIIVLPYFGVLLYLIVRGGSMSERAVQRATADQEAFRAYVRGAGGGSDVDQLAKLADLHDAGKVSENEYQALKSRLLITS